MCCFDIIIAIYYHGLKENAIEVNRRAAYNCLRRKGICRIQKIAGKYIVYQISLKKIIMNFQGGFL